jgi:hypothetical protein
VPALQPYGAVALAGQYAPAGHTAHAVEEAKYFPAGQPEQAAAPAAENRPVAQPVEAAAPGGQ